MTDQTDRELLEAAAKAAGVEVVPYTWDKDAPWGEHHGFTEAYRGPDEWNPLHNDGQALRLAVKMKVWIRYRDDNSVNVCWYDDKGFFAGNVVEEIGSLRNGDEPNAAVRRAIVRVAATIGKTGEPT